MSTLEADAVTAASGTNTALSLRGRGTGKVALGDANLLVPDADGAAGQIATTDGSANLTFAATPGTSGNVLTSNGSAWTSAAAAGGGGFESMQVFTVTDTTPPYASNTATWTRPAGVTKIKVYVTGGGGGAGSILNSSFAGYGGASGGTSIKVIDVSAISSVTVTLGKGGTASNLAYQNGNGETGGTSSFGSHCSATGGDGGGASTNTATANMQADAGEGSGGDLNLRGSPPSGQFNNSSGAYYGGGPGGASFWAGGGLCVHQAYTTGFDEVAASGVDGSGGGGGSYGSSYSYSGGSGGGGIVVVEEYA